MTIPDTTTATETPRPNVPGGPNFRLTIAANDPDDGPQEIRAERSDLEDLEAVEIGNQLAEFVRNATSDEFNDFYKVLTTWVRNRRAGCPVDFYRAAIIDRLEPDNWHNKASQELLVYGFERLLALANQVRYELTSSDDSGARLRELIDALPATLREDAALRPETPTVSRDDIDEEFMSYLNASVSRFLRAASEDDLLDLSGALEDWQWRCKADKPIPFASSAIAARFLDGSEESRRAEGILLDGLERLQGICDAVPEKGPVANTMWAVLSGAPDVPAVVVGRSLECGNCLVPEIEHFLAGAPSDELDTFWHVLRRRRRAENNGRPCGILDAATMELIHNDDEYQGADAERLFLEGVGKLTDLANEVAGDHHFTQGAGQKLRAIVEEIPETLFENEDAETREAADREQWFERGKR